MHTGADVPDIIFARIRIAGGPYRVGDGIAIAYSSPSVARLVALDTAVRARCANYERTAVPEIVSATVEHAVAPDEAGDLTLYFVDPAIARIRRDPPQPQTQAGRTEQLGATQGLGGTSEDRIPRSDVEPSRPQTHEGEPMTLRADDRMTDERADADPAPDEPDADELVSPGDFADEPPANERVADGSEARAGIVVRLEWSPERVRRFIQVVDRLFTIDRLGWYRHCLAMRLLIPDEIRSGDELADVEAMRHLHALRSAAVSALGKPLLAACMPGFAVTSDWLETLESSREARAIAGLRDALLPYATDTQPAVRSRTVDAASTVGSVRKRALLAESATSVESFLPILIPTEAHDVALCSRLTDYRDLLVELFAQTARATGPVRLGTLTQPNHSLDDRLWQLVGAVGEAFGGFVHT